jgi:hypothetical protein
VQRLSRPLLTARHRDRGPTNDPRGVRDSARQGLDRTVDRPVARCLEKTRHEFLARSHVCRVREPGSQQRIEIYSGGYLNFEPDRPTIVWSVAELPRPLLAWGGEIPASFGGGRPPDQLSAPKT